MAIKVLSLSMDDREWSWLDARAAEIGCSRSALVRELISAMSNLRPVWTGPLLRWQFPRFKWGENDEGRFL